MDRERQNMDIRKRKRHINIKQLTLGAAATAVLALNPNAATATSCPPFITGTDLANEVCSFDTGTAVTVENGGEVAGIAMDSYSGSQITVASGGTINGTPSSIGINLTNASLTNGMINNGTIRVANTVISIANSTVGNISNSGTITSTLHGTGIKIDKSNVGDITNSGTITASSYDTGIAMLGSTSPAITTTVSNITNTGTITSEIGNSILMSKSVITNDLTNNGSIVSHSGDGIALRNVSRIENTLSNSGTINAGDVGIKMSSESTISGSISNSGSIKSSTYGIQISSSSIDASISNSGTIKGGSTGIAISGSATNTMVGGGISNSGTIQGDINAINIMGSAVVSNINILGTHARIIGNVEAPNSTINITSGANFTSEGSFTTSSFNIASNAIFNMANAITATTGFNNSGTLSVNQLQTISGDYTQNTGGVFQTGVTNATNYGQLVVDGNTDLSQSGHINVEIGQNASLHTGTVLSNVISGNTFTSPTAGFTVTDNSFLWNFVASINNTNTGVNLTASINSAAYNVCNGLYCQGAANAIIDQVAAGNSTFNPYTRLATGSAFQTAASQAAPVLSNANTPLLQFITNSVIDVIPTGSTFSDKSGGESGGDAMLYQPGKVWVKPYGGSASQNQTSTLAGYNATVYGVVIGRDITPSQDWLFGGAIAAGGDNLDGEAQISGQSINSGTYQGMLYAVKTFHHDIYLAEQGLVGYGDNDTSRDIPLYNTTAQGTYNSWFTNLRAELGKHFTFHQNFVLTPEIDASYLFVNQTAYQESNSPMDLSVNSNNVSSLVLGAYANASYHFISLKSLWDTALTTYIGIADNVLNSEPENTATFVAGGPNFTTGGVQFNQLVFRGGVGLAVSNPVKPFSLNLNYDLQSGSNVFNNVGSITLSYKI